MQGFNQYFEQQANVLIKKANNLRDRSKRQHAYRAAILTIYGFQVAIPVLLGLFLGRFLDKNFAVNHISWVLNFVLLGALVGFYNANTWFCRTIQLKRTPKNTATLKKGRKK